jgi:hypothetical protein
VGGFQVCHSALISIGTESAPYSIRGPGFFYQFPAFLGTGSGFPFLAFTRTSSTAVTTLVLLFLDAHGRFTLMRERYITKDWPTISQGL